MTVRSFLLCLGMLGVSVSPTYSWGVKTHLLINEIAVEALGNTCGGFFLRHRRELRQRAVEPDTVLRTKYGQREAVRHFIDLDAYGPYPFAALPREYRAAVRAHGREVVRKHGVLPWTILDLHSRLIRAFTGKEWAVAARTAGHLGHYVGDAFMPLHTTKNHDGQLTGNRGIHLRIENGLVDERIEQYRERAERRVPSPEHINDRQELLFARLLESYRQVEVLLQTDRRSRGLWPFSYHDRYYQAMDRAVGKMLADRIAGAGAALASLWLTACEEKKRGLTP